MAKKLWQILEENKEENIKNYQKTTEAAYQKANDLIANQNNTKANNAVTLPVNNNKKKLLQKTGFVAKSTGTGIASGLGGLVQAGLTDAANQLNKGKEKNPITTATEFFKYLVSPQAIVTDIPRNMLPVIKENIKTLKEKDKNVIQKVGAMLTNTSSGVMNETTPKKIMNLGLNLAGKANKDLGNMVLGANNKISEPINKMNKSIAEESQNYDGVTRTIGKVGQVVGNMAPSVATTAITKDPNLGLTIMGISAKGQATQEALQKGAELDEAVKIGDTKGMVEIGTEMLTGGLNIFGKGALDDLITRGIDKKVTSQVLNYLGKQGAGIAGEIGEETISDILDTIIDKGTVDPNATYSLKDWSDTALTTTLSTVVLNALGGGYTPRSYQENIQNIQEYQNNTKQNQQNIINNQDVANNQEIEQAKPNIINDKVNDYINNIRENFNSEINIDTKSLNEGNQIFVDYNRVNQSGLAKKAESLVDKFKRRIFRNNNEDIYVTNGDIKKSISETLRNREQKQYKIENLAVFSQLDKVIEKAKEISFNKNDNKGRNQYSDYKYYVSNAYIDGNPYVVEFDTRLQKGTSGNLERHFRLERVYPINNNEVVSNTVPKVDNTFLNETTSNNSIPQSTENVKNDSIINNYSMLENENNTLPIQEDIIQKERLPVNEKTEEKRVAEILERPIQKVKENDRKWAILKAGLLDKGIVFEELSQKTNNRELQGKWDYTLTSGSRGQNAIGNARYKYDSQTKTQKQISKSLEDIRTEVGNRTSDFNKYMYHLLNIDRMTLENRYGTANKPVFSNDITAEVSREIVDKLNEQYPDFKEIAQDVYDYNNANKMELVKNGVISQELSDKLGEMYPHYVPIKRVDTKGVAIKVPLDTNRTGVNSPLARATGGTSNIQPLFETMADRTMQTYRASARNNFGLELLNTLNSQIETVATDVDSIVDQIGTEESDSELLKEGKNGNNPTFTVFNNGEKTTFEITKDMYDALKPISDSSILSKRSKTLNTIGNIRRGVLTEYNPIFSITNALKDAQDVVVNSQHVAKTFSKFPEAYSQIVSKGYWYNEYIQNGGEQNSYFKDGEFTSDKKVPVTKKAISIPLETISRVNNIIEMAPRLAEYIVSRESGRSIETSMLDAARVTTNFKAGGDITKFANRNGATFLNASVQGFQQQIRNIKEANAKGLKGYAILAGKYTVAGVIPYILNSLLWKDDKDYEELQDYAKDNYYCVAKYGDGKFIRIPKGRVAATLQKIVSNVGKYVTENNKLNIDNFAKDFWEDLKFGMDNVAPNNPLDNNVISPIIQAITNTSWYGEDIVPSRLQKKPKAEQYDETTDSISKWLGERLNISPYKINYLLDQYSGGVGDILLPMMTKQAENNVIEDKFTTDSIMKSKYPGEFFEKADEIEIKSNSEKASDADILKHKYMYTISSEMSELYKQKREVQNSNLTDKQKKEELKEIQKQINEKAKTALENVDKLKITNNTAIIGNTKYYKDNNKESWSKVTNEDLNKMGNVSLKTYADFKNKISGLSKDSEKIDVLLKANYSENEKEKIYENYINNKDTTYQIIKKAQVGIDDYLKYKSNTGTTKASIVDYLNSNKNLSKNQKLLIIGLKYSLTNQEKTQLAHYINSLNIKKTEKLDIYRKIKGFTVNDNGTIKW